ncbi:hypothetical protein C8R43DRAFT_955208 [Mycena crocata]|nr:hypothetical protein C8R43DRAFT_955208 [Mycena crocata]
MKEDVTSRVYGMYDGTGVFPTLCRYGFCLIMVDMIKSGELAQYGYAVAVHLMRILGPIGLGYDIGCKFAKMVRAHPTLSSLACDTKFRSLVGAFHGAGHKCACQAKNLTVMRTHVMHMYHGLSLILASKYHNTLKIKRTLPALEEMMRQLHVPDRHTFETWLEAASRFLQTLSKEPLEETLQMEYYQKLVKLLEHEESENRVGTGATCHSGQLRMDMTPSHTIKLHAKSLTLVQDLKLQLGGVPCWVPGNQGWVATVTMVNNRHYQRATGSPMSELTKVNMSGTTKALQTRLKAVKKAIERYNNVAEAMTPLRTTLSWEEVVEYTFMADFDLLHDGHEDILNEPWVQAAGRVAMDQHFKLLRADEEIVRLDVEIPRFVTSMVDEECFLVYHLCDEGKAGLAHQVRLQCINWMFRSNYFDEPESRAYCEEFGQTIRGLVGFKTNLRLPTHGPIEGYISYPFEMTTSTPKWGLDKLWNKGVGPQKGYNLASLSQADD